MELLSSAGSSKRAKAPGNMTQVVSCLVDGCNSDLSRCREYHRRHKVCEHHSKTPKVTIGGQEQRFCQQCSRFHSLIEFDEGKRSCRKRLDGHNRRRRKPQSESFHRTPGIFHSSQHGPSISKNCALFTISKIDKCKGSRLLSFSNPQILPGYVSSARAGDVKREDDTMVFNSPSNYTDKHNLSTRSSAHSYKGGLNQFQFLQGTDHNLLEASSVCQPLFDPISASGNCANSQKMLPDRLNRVGNNHGALSLLSSARTETRDIGSSHMVHPDPIPMSQSLLQNLHFSGLDQYPCTHGMETKPEVSDLGSNITTLHFQGVCQNEFDDSSGSGSQQTLLFRWN